MKLLRCIIVEDEPLAAEVLEDYIKEVPFLKLEAIYTDALYALEALQQQVIDVIFLDLHLPKLKGFDFVKTLSNPPQIIVTTAYHQYALQGYELAIVDYLLKPIEFSRFLKAVNKLNIASSSLLTKPIPINCKSPTTNHLFFNVNKKQVKVKLADILYIESLKEYIKIHTTQKTLVTKFQIGQIAEQLGKVHFIRIHRSFLVAKNHIDAYTSTTVEVGQQILPIGRNYRAAVAQVLSP